ncbi:MAG TPA: helix-turn-helix domain-containing protein [Polyangiaceae bacterium]|jgi:DNA-binding transcriptional ArsR family regulator|nr:helix-turn-helix domain-containing protein [Polyangiaceae bacterium]
MEGSELPETYELTSLEQMRTLADELRMRAVDALTYRPMTVTQLGEFLGQAPAKVHYHVRELERVGLVKLVETREKGGILEKYYRSVAKSFRATDMLLRTQSSDEVLAHLRAFLEWNVENFVHATAAAIRANPEQPAHGMGGSTGSQLWLTPDEGKQFFKELDDLMNRYSTPRGIEGEQERTFVWMAYDPRLASTAAGTEANEAPKPETTARTVRSIVVGAFTYLRKDLEQAIARGERIDLNVIGACSFADDVSPELVERAIARFRYRGLLHASEAVREALKHKAPTQEA